MCVQGSEPTDSWVAPRMPSPTHTAPHGSSLTHPQWLLTWSPTLNLSTSGPTAVTTPTISWPGTIGYSGGWNIFLRCPAEVWRSVWHTPQNLEETTWGVSKSVDQVTSSNPAELRVCCVVPALLCLLLTRTLALTLRTSEVPKGALAFVLPDFDQYIVGAERTALDLDRPEAALLTACHRQGVDAGTSGCVGRHRCGFGCLSCIWYT